jgi:hypothetical protein
VNRARVLAVLVLFSLPSIADAQPSPTPEEQASAAFDRGQRAFEDDDYAGALAAFEEALRLAPSDVVRFNMGLCLERLARFRAALAAYQTVSASAELDDATRADASQRAERVRTRLGTLVFPGPAGARVEVTGVEECTAPCRMSVDPGTHEVRRTDGEGRVLSVTVDRGEEHVVDLAPPVAPPPPPPPPRRGGLRIGLVGWIGAGVAVVGAVATVALGLRVLSLKEDYLADPTRDGLDAGRAAVTATNVSLVVAIVGAAVLAVDLLFLHEGKGPEPARPDRLALTF